MSQSSYLERLARRLVQLPCTAASTTGTLLSEMLLFMLDRSGSMAASCGHVDRLQAAQAACVGLIDARLNQGADDQVAVMIFNDQAELILPYTSCRKHRPRIERAVRAITADGGTALRAPLALALEMIPEQGSFHVVLLSDGHGGQPGRCHQQLKAAGAVIETIGVGHDPSEVDEPTLQEIASVHHGKTLYRFIRDAGELATYFRTEIANRLSKRE